MSTASRLSATKLREILRTVDVFNASNFADTQGSPVFLSYRIEDRGRGSQCAAWQVHQVNVRTDPEPGYWRDHGDKTFNIFRRGQKREQEDAAKAWAGEKFGVTEWAKTPFGSWMDAEFVKTRLAELLAKAEEVGREQ